MFIRYPVRFHSARTGVLPAFQRGRGLAEILACFLLLHVIQPLPGQVPDKDSSSIIYNLLNRADSMVRNPGMSKTPGKWSELPVRSSDSLKTSHNVSRFNREWNSLLQRFYASESDHKKAPVANSNLNAYDGVFIRKLEIKKVNVFAKNTLDTSYIPSNWLQKAGTTIQTGTRDRIIARNLLLKSGDRLDVFLAAENERLIRNMPYIQDARFLVRPVPGEPDSVDLILLTRDLLPVGFNLELGSARTGNAGIGYYNILGYGHQFVTSTFWNGDHKPVLGYRLLYGIPSISGSFISTELEHTDGWGTKTDRIRISRDFKTVGFKNAGAMQIERSALIRDIVLPDSTLPEVSWKYLNYEFWMGRIIPLKKSNPTGISSGLFLSGRVFHIHNTEGPLTSEHHFYAFQDKTQLLFSGGFSRRGFRKDNQIYTFDRIEDIPFGYLLNFTSGLEWGQYKTRTYFGASASVAKYFAHAGYLFSQVEYGTFVDGQSLEQGALRVQIRGFTRLHNMNRFQYRNFATLTYLDGINRYKEEFTSLENRGGISGLTSPALRGNEKITLSLESVIFSPYRFYGFRFAFFGTIDLGFIKTEDLSFFDFKPYSGISLGVRIRNEQLVFDTFELKFSFYPGEPVDARPTPFKIGSVPRLRFNELFPDKPGVVDFF
jgi:hypothetical protein